MNSRTYNRITCGLNYAFEFVEQVKKIVSCLIDKSLKKKLLFYFIWINYGHEKNYLQYILNGHVYHYALTLFITNIIGWLKIRSSFVEVRTLELQIFSLVTIHVCDLNDCVHFITSSYDHDLEKHKISH